MPGAPESVAELEDRLSEPSAELVKLISELEGDFLILGAGGKMGPSLARMARRAVLAAGAGRRVIAVSRFSDDSLRAKLQSDGVETIAADLLDPPNIERLPECNNVIYLAGTKFGTTGDEPRLWATNAYLPSLVARRFSGGRIVCLSTGNVYGLVSAHSTRGSAESDPPAPVGEYAMSCLARERIFQFFSEQNATPMVLLRLNYATEMRYGVLVDLACKIINGQAISLEMGYFNTIWQGDACDLTLRSLSLASSPPFILNVTGCELVSCREVACRLGELLGREPVFVGQESATALLSDSSRAIQHFGRPRVSLDNLTEWTAEWIRHGGNVWHKPTHFETRDGRF